MRTAYCPSEKTRTKNDKETPGNTEGQMIILMIWAGVIIWLICANASIRHAQEVDEILNNYPPEEEKQDGK